MGFRMTHTTQTVLRVLAQNPEAELYGMEIARITGLLPGTTYPILVRLQDAGWVVSRWEDIDPVQEKRPARRYYQLTAHGLEQAVKALTERPPPVASAVLWQPAGNYGSL